MNALSFVSTVILSSMVSVAAFAYPAVGDQIKFAGNITGNGQTLNISGEIEIVSYDAASDQFEVRQTVEAGGQKNVTVAKSPKAEMLSSEQMKEVLATCAEQGGKLGKVSVKAGTFEACVFTGQTEEGGKIVSAFGDVPFGLLRSLEVAPDGVTSEFQLIEFKRGK